jgi:hypothetical protein
VQPLVAVKGMDHILVIWSTIFPVCFHLEGALHMDSEIWNVPGGKKTQHNFNFIVFSLHL